MNDHEREPESYAPCSMKALQEAEANFTSVISEQALETGKRGGKLEVATIIKFVLLEKSNRGKLTAEEQALWDCADLICQNMGAEGPSKEVDGDESDGEAEDKDGPTGLTAWFKKKLGLVG